MKALRRVVLVSLLPLCACAWARRENRPVWTVFEQNLVPESQAAFVVALPVTVPLGLLAILTDTFVAHPLQVVDDAADDAADLWRHIDLEKSYYTEAGWMPLRAVATPVWFAGSFLGRSMFDVRSSDEQQLDLAEHERQRRANTLAWLQRIAAGGDEQPPWAPPGQLDAELAAAVADALARATPLGRLQLYRQAAAHTGWRAHVDPLRGLQDPSAVVRFRVLETLPQEIAVPDALQQRLLADPDEAVRALAARPRRR